MFTQLKNKIDFFEKTGTMLDAGVSVLNALNSLAGESAGRFSDVALRMKEKIQSGSTLTDAAEKEEVFTSFECQMIRTGEESGHLDAVFKHISEWLTSQLTSQRKFINGLLLPALVLHLAFLIIPFPQFILSNMSISAYLVQALTPAAIIDGIFIALFILPSRLEKMKPVREIVLALLAPIPLIGTLLRTVSLQRFVYAYSILIRAGVGPVRSLETASQGLLRSSEQTRIRQSMDSVASGQPVCQSIKQTNLIPADILSMWEVGETSGKEDETFVKINATLKDRAARRIDSLVFWTPKIIYICVALYIAYTILIMASGIYTRTTDILNS